MSLEPEVEEPSKRGGATRLEVEVEPSKRKSTNEERRHSASFKWAGRRVWSRRWSHVRGRRRTRNDAEWRRSSGLGDEFGAGGGAE
jgi:hypothetical protein